MDKFYKYNYMDDIFLTKLLFIVIICIFLVFIHIFVKKKEAFQATPQPSKEEKLDQSHESLRKAQQKCNELEIEYKQNMDKEQLRIEEASYYRLKELNDELNDLETILKTLITKVNMQKNINEKCGTFKQQKINKEFEHLLKLDEQNLVGDESVDIDLNVSDYLKNIKFNPGVVKQGKSSSKSVEKCSHPDKDMIDVVKNKDIIESKCHNCKVDKLINDK